MPSSLPLPPIFSIDWQGPTDHTRLPDGCLPDDVYSVLLTGFGPSAKYPENPSWLAIKPLRGRWLSVEPDYLDVHRAFDNTVHHGTTMIEGDLKMRRRYIRISTVQIPMEYDAIMELTPALHMRPPVLPEDDDEISNPAPPPDGYDFIFHIGCAGRGPLRLEKAAHKTGYHMKDEMQKHAPEVIIPEDPNEVIVNELPPPPAFPQIDLQIGETQPFLSSHLQIGAGPIELGNRPIIEPPPTRGFGITEYKNLEDELHSDVEPTKIVKELKRLGFDLVHYSMDAGHYLTDFLYYCSLAESRRNRKTRTNKGNGLFQFSRLYDAQRPGFHQIQVPVLCMHCPPVNSPLSSSEVAEQIKRIVCWVIAGL